MASLKIFNQEGKEVETLELEDQMLEREKGEQAVHDSVVAFLAKMRAGTASTKTRSEVRGSGAKPYRQKGTGRARAGSAKSPLWIGGGIAFGPKPRSFKKRINKKVQRLALKRALTARIDAGDLILVDEVKIAEPKTRYMVDFLKEIDAGQDVLFVVDELDINLHLASRNLPHMEVMEVNALNPYWVLLFKKIIMTRAAFETLKARLLPQETAQ